MLRKFVCAVAILGLSLGIAMAEEIKGKITKIDEKKVTVIVGAKKGEKGEAKDFEIGKDCKVCKMDKKNKVEVAGGLKADELKNIDEKKGLQAILTVTDGKVTEIILAGKKKKDVN